MPDIDPRQVNYDSQDYGTGPDGRRYNRQGNETWESEYIHNVNETYRQNEEARINYENSQKNSNNYDYSGYVSSVGSGPSFSLGGLFTGFLGLLTGWFGLFIIAALLYVGAIMFGFLKYHSTGIIGFFSKVFEVIAAVFTMPFTAWPTLLKDFWHSLFNPLETIFAIGIIVYTISYARNNEFFPDKTYETAIIGMIVLEFIHHFFNDLGLIGSIYNGLCLSIPVLIILAVVEKIKDR